MPRQKNPYSRDEISRAARRVRDAERTLKQVREDAQRLREDVDVRLTDAILQWAATGHRERLDQLLAQREEADRMLFLAEQGLRKDSDRGDENLLMRYERQVSIFDAELDERRRPRDRERTLPAWLVEPENQADKAA